MKDFLIVWILTLPIMAQISDSSGKVWTFPATFIGLLIGHTGQLIAAFGLLNVSVSMKHNAICFENFPWGRHNSAITLGNCIIATCSLNLRMPTYESLDDKTKAVQWVTMGNHEEAHTYQFQRWGLFFFASWLICGGPHNSDHFERQADRYALNKEAGIK